jgi:murein L,D-transpeptidase YafK
MTIMRKMILLLCIITACATLLLFAEKPAIISNNIKKPITKMVVIKSKKILQVYNNNQLLKTYSCGIGLNEKGNKQQEGDNRTPEGTYYITARNDKSSYYKNLHINYPNDADRKRCKARGVSTGGDIKIHGIAQRSIRNVKYDYTWGCIGVTNANMDELYKYVVDNCEIKILP